MIMFLQILKDFLMIIGSCLWPPTGFPIQIKSVPFFPHSHLWSFFLCAGILKALPSPPRVVFLNFPKCLHPFAIGGWFFCPLPGSELETFAKGGFYVTSPRPGLTLSCRVAWDVSFFLVVGALGSV